MTVVFRYALPSAMAAAAIALALVPASGTAGDYADFGSSASWYAKDAAGPAVPEVPRVSLAEAEIGAGWLRRSVRLDGAAVPTGAGPRTFANAPATPDPDMPRIGPTRAMPVVGFGFAERIEDGRVEIGFGAGLLKAADRAPDVVAAIDLLKSGPDLRARGQLGLDEPEELDPAIGVSIVYRLDARARAVMPR